jgi:hypothetical protein
VSPPPNDGDGARPAFYGAYRKGVDVPSEDVIVTGQAIAADGDDRWLGVTLVAFARNGLITDATRTIPEQPPRNFSTALVAQRVSEGGPCMSTPPRSVTEHVQ